MMRRRGKVSVEILPFENIANKIYLIKGRKVMLDYDLARLYNVQTKRLKEQVKRNQARFPDHFLFELTKHENNSLRSQNATLEKGRHSKYLPYAFTEHGILMLSNILKSKRSIAVSIRIIDVFVRLREIVVDNAELKLEIEHIKQKVNNHSKNIELVFQYLDELVEKRQKKKPRRKIGFRIARSRRKAEIIIYGTYS